MPTLESFLEPLPALSEFCEPPPLYEMAFIAGTSARSIEVIKRSLFSSSVTAAVAVVVEHRHSTQCQCNSVRAGTNTLWVSYHHRH